MAQNVTSIDNLPEASTKQEPVQNVVMQQKPIPQPIPPQQPPQPQQQPPQPQQQPQQQIPTQTSQEQEDIVKQIVSGLRNAEQQGLTSLPSNLMNTNTQQYTHDAQVQPNYIPQQPQTHQIMMNDRMNTEQIQQYAERKIKSKQTDNLIQNLQQPLIIAVVIMFSHLPIVQRIFYKHFELLFHKQGELNMYGLMTIGIFFSSFYYIGTKLLEFFNEE